MSRDTEKVGYTYQNPNDKQGELPRIEVVRTDKIIDFGQIGPKTAAIAAQKVIQDALANRFSGTLDVEQVNKTANPNDEEMVNLQAGRFLTSKILKDKAPIYVSARIPAEGANNMRPIAGVGKLKYADGRPRWQRMFSDSDPANLADIGDVYVRPESLLAGMKLQKRGIGLAIWRTMLDYCPEDMPTIVYEFPNLDDSLPSRLERVGFRAHDSRVVEFCGVETRQVDYRGPLCGDLIEALEAEQPWLANREPITL